MNNINLPDQTENELIEKIISVANAMINGEINLVKGSREINILRVNTRYDQDKVFDTFILIADDTDYIPVDDEVRKRWNSDALKKMDIEMDEYARDMESTILDACKEVIRLISRP